LISLVAASALTALTGFAHAQALLTSADGVLLTSADCVLVTAAGMTAYNFDQDVAGSGKSACSGPCAALWPAVTAAADARPEGALSLLTREDGIRQWAYKGKPVYRYSGDTQPGDRKGDNFRNMWHIVRP
jgi:predicted lipoprotein with Yx(FWY)xxD motif